MMASLRIVLFCVGLLQLTLCWPEPSYFCFNALQLKRLENVTENEKEIHGRWIQAPWNIVLEILEEMQ